MIYLEKSFYLLLTPRLIHDDCDRQGTWDRRRYRSNPRAVIARWVWVVNYLKPSTNTTHISLIKSRVEIESFCQVNFGVTFPLMAKIDVNGKNEDPVYAFLKSQKSGLMGLTRIKWNFEKFLIRKDGTVYERYSSATSPTSIAKDIEELLAEQ